MTVYTVFTFGTPYAYTSFIEMDSDTLFKNPRARYASKLVTFTVHVLELTLLSVHDTLVNVIRCPPMFIRSVKEVNLKF